MDQVSLRTNISKSTGGRPLWARVTLSLPPSARGPRGCTSEGHSEDGGGSYCSLPTRCPHVTLTQPSMHSITVPISRWGKGSTEVYPQGCTQSRWPWDWNQGHSEAKPMLWPVTPHRSPRSRMGPVQYFQRFLSLTTNLRALDLRCIICVATALESCGSLSSTNQLLMFPHSPLSQRKHTARSDICLHTILVIFITF